VRKASHPDASTQEQRASACEERDVDTREGQARTGARGVAGGLFATRATTGARRSADATLVAFDILLYLSLGAVGILRGLRESRSWKYQHRYSDHHGNGLLEPNLHSH
jgi:hypothetical protein